MPIPGDALQSLARLICAMLHHEPHFCDRVLPFLIFRDEALMQGWAEGGP